MLGVNFLAVAVAAVAAFVASSVWYISLSGQLTKVRSANPGAVVDIAKASAETSDLTASAVRSAPGWKKIVELVRTLVPAYLLAYLLGLLGVAGWLAAVRLGFWLWVGFP